MMLNSVLILSRFTPVNHRRPPNLDAFFANIDRDCHETNLFDQWKITTASRRLLLTNGPDAVDENLDLLGGRSQVFWLIFVEKFQKELDP